jgi:hypothetical protein
MQQLFCRFWLRGGFPGKEDAKRIQEFTNQWGIDSKVLQYLYVGEYQIEMANSKYVGQVLWQRVNEKPTSHTTKQLIKLVFPTYSYIVDSDKTSTEHITITQRR